MIWAAIATAIAVALGVRGGSPESNVAMWLDEWRNHLRRYVRDDERRAAAEAILDDEFEHLEAYFLAVDVQMHALYDVHLDYAANLDDYVPYIDDMLATFGELQHQQVAAFSEMHSALRADEWSTIEEHVGKQIVRDQSKAAKRAAKAAKAQK